MKNFGKLNGVDMQASLNKMLRNPMLIHMIEDKLRSMTSTNFLAFSIKSYLNDGKIEEAINCPVEVYQDNPKSVIATIGVETWKLICEYKNIPYHEIQA